MVSYYMCVYVCVCVVMCQAEPGGIDAIDYALLLRRFRYGKNCSCRHTTSIRVCVCVCFKLSLAA
jgi:hypothetical protein